MKAKDAIKYLSKLKPDEEIAITWWDMEFIRDLAKDILDPTDNPNEIRITEEEESSVMKKLILEVEAEEFDDFYYLIQDELEKIKEEREALK
jgi:hypothetical protein